tara:strand:- start:178 stop:477 length:300 start_codon:yes stop_codon:yes gene_type:complete
MVRFVSYLLALSANHCVSVFRWHLHLFMAGAYAVLKRPADVPNPTTDATAATRRAGAIVKTCTTVRGRTTAVVLERSFGVLFFFEFCWCALFSSSSRLM